ncbi:MAG: sodium/proline symporter [Abyssibacter sp.]|nr:sodium/proline symporter [Abyssibacter sp.]MCK5860777.1 sodium/proline symporter [Abyssibacter sp.]
MDRSAIILTTLVAYKLFLIGIGLWAQRRTRDASDYFLGDRQLGPLVAAISYSASSSSAWTLLGMSGAAFVMGVSALWLVAGSVSGMLVAWFYVAPRLMQLSHRNGLLTLTDVVAWDCRGPWRGAIVLTSSVIVLFALSFYVAAQFQGAGNTFHQTFDLSLTRSITIGAVIILIYTLLGGFWAVSLTDTIQGLLMAVAAILLPVAALVKIGGFQDFWDGLLAVSSPEQLSLTGRNTGLLALGFIGGIAGISFGTFGQPHLLVRFMALRDGSALRQARWITIAWFLVVFGGMCFLGLAGHVLLNTLENPEFVFFAMTDALFPTVVGAILVAAVLSAIMSTADSQLLVGASVVAHDLGLTRRFPSRQLLIARMAMIGLTVIAVVISVTLPSTIFQRALLAWTALGASFGPLVFFRAASIAVHPAGVFAAIATGFLTATLFHFFPEAATGVIGVPANLAVTIERVGSFAIGVVILALFRGDGQRA